jgi:acetyl esterase/lipase
MMKNKSVLIITILLFCAIQIPAQNIGDDYPRDTSYTIYSAYFKYVQQYPSIKIVQPENSKAILRFENIIYANYENRKMYLDVFQPFEGEKLPAVIMIHGGGWVSGDKSLLRPLAEKIAQAGYVVLLIEYRLAPEAKYPAAIFDIKTAIKWIKSNSDCYSVDTTKIALLGSSAGGQLAALVGTTSENKLFESGDSSNCSDKVQAIIDIDGVLDMTDPAESGKDDDPDNPSVGKRWFGFTYKENPGIWEQASAVNYIDKNTPPIEFINSSFERFHAGRDEVVTQLKSYGTYYEIHTLPDSPHSFWLFDPWFEPTCKYVIDFLNKVFIKG